MGAIFASLAALLLASNGFAHEEIEEIYGGLGTTSAVDEGVENEAATTAQSAGRGTIAGQVFDSETGAALQGVTVILEWADASEGSTARQEVATTDFGGSFEFRSVPPGQYTISFVKAGYRASAMKDVEVRAGVLNRADFPLPRVAAETSEDILELEPFVVDAAVAGEMMTALELRMDSDAMLDVMTAEDFSKYAASDVAEALKRVAGVNVVAGKFAYMRGLEDRYSSTLYNGGVIPSPDPDRQSVQLDLFPAEVLSNMQVAKSFTAELPGNSSGGSIDLITHDYPEEFQIKLELAGGINDRAASEFLRFEDRNPMGVPTSGLDTLSGELGLSVGGRRDFFRREFRTKAVFNWNYDNDTLQGYQEGLEPVRGTRRQTGDLALGQLGLTDGRFRLTESDRSRRYLGYFGLGFDLDEEGRHTIDTSAFYIHKRAEKVQLRYDGYLPDFEEPTGADGYPTLFSKYVTDESVGWAQFDSRATLSSWVGGQGAVRELNTNPPNKPAWWSNFQDSRSFLTERDLLIAQANGSDTFSGLDGFTLTWAANYAKTKQFEEARGAKFYFEPTVLPNWDDPADRPTPPITVEDLGGEGLYTANDNLNFSQVKIDERQGFGRIDAEYERKLLDPVLVELKGGAWYEHASRSVEAAFLEDPNLGTGVLQWFLQAPTPLELGREIDRRLNKKPDGSLDGVRNTQNESTREITAGHLGLKTTFWDDVDLVGGVRLEHIFIESLNEAFTGGLVQGAPRTFPVVYLHFDRLDNPSDTRAEVSPNFNPEGFVFNDQILGIDVPAGDPCLPRYPDYRCVDLAVFDSAGNILQAESRDLIRRYINGTIDEVHFLPSVGAAYRPLEGLSLRAAYSKTVARPSFREMGYYVTVDPGTDDLVVGNPQLKLSKVWSVDGRIEYTWGQLGDLFALSAYYKGISRPIEAIVLRDPVNFEYSGTALFRTFFNNPNDARLWGIEAEARKALDFIGLDFGQYFSLGGNFTYINAEVKRSEEELRRAEEYFLVNGGDVPIFSGLAETRRLYGQPKWIANADLTFDQPDWGTKLTLAFFAISDVLDAAGSAVISPNRTTGSLTLDRYVDSYHQLDLIASQKFRVEALHGDITLKFRIKNLMDSTRRIVYDPNQLVRDYVERAYKTGRDYKFSVSYEF